MSSNVFETLSKMLPNAGVGDDLVHVCVFRTNYELNPNECMGRRSNDKIIFILWFNFIHYIRLMFAHSDHREKNTKSRLRNIISTLLCRVVGKY